MYPVTQLKPSQLVDTNGAPNVEWLTAIGRIRSVPAAATDAGRPCRLPAQALGMPLSGGSSLSWSLERRWSSV